MMAVTWVRIFPYKAHSLKTKFHKKIITGKSKILYLNTTQYLLITKHSVLVYEEASISEISNSITKWCIGGQI